MLNIMDFYSRYNYIFIFRKSKQLNSKNAAKSLITVIDEAKRMGYTINKIICDNGSEFLGNFKKMCNEKKTSISNKGDGLVGCVQCVGGQGNFIV